MFGEVGKSGRNSMQRDAVEGGWDCDRSHCVFPIRCAGIFAAIGAATGDEGGDGGQDCGRRRRRRRARLRAAAALRGRRLFRYGHGYVSSAFTFSKNEDSPDSYVITERAGCGWGGRERPDGDDDGGDGDGLRVRHPHSRAGSTCRSSSSSHHDAEGRPRGYTLLEAVRTHRRVQRHVDALAQRRQAQSGGSPPWGKKGKEPHSPVLHSFISHRTLRPGIACVQHDDAPIHHSTPTCHAR